MAAAAAAAAMVSEESAPYQIGETKAGDQNESASRRKSTPGNFQWSDADKSMVIMSNSDLLIS
jgi:hypothetical protein